MNDDLIKIYNNFGFETQFNKLIEESHETVSALKNYKTAYWLDQETKELFLSYLDELNDQLNVALGIARVKYGITVEEVTAMRFGKIARTLKIMSISKDTGESYDEVRRRVR